MSEVRCVNAKIEFESELGEKGWDVNMRGKSIAFAHFKGGTGKTTSCQSIADYLHELWDA